MRTISINNILYRIDKFIIPIPSIVSFSSVRSGFHFFWFSGVCVYCCGPWSPEQTLHWHSLKRCICTVRFWLPSQVSGTSTSS